MAAVWYNKVQKYNTYALLFIITVLDLRVVIVTFANQYTQIDQIFTKFVYLMT